MSGCLGVSSCATQPTRARLNTAAAIVVLHPGIPSKPYYHKTTDAMNLVPLVNWAYPAIKDAQLGVPHYARRRRLGSRTVAKQWSMHFQGRSLRPTLVAADHPTTIGVPQLLSTQQLHSIAGQRARGGLGNHPIRLHRRAWR